ncbi:hypothetical protein ES703_118620 [subsurface metagenome]
MATLNQIIRERRLVFADLKKLIKVVDSAGERSERLVNRVLSRRLKVPEYSDLSKVLSHVSEQEKGLRSLVGVLRAGFPV